MTFLTLIQAGAYSMPNFLKSSTALAGLIGTAALLTAPVAYAQGAPEAEPVATAMPKAPPTADFSMRLLEMMVKKGLVTREEADSMVADAEAAAGDDPAVLAEARDALRDEPNSIIVPYIPESVRQKIAAEVRADIIKEARVAGWAQEGEVPEWSKRVKISGDLRVRTERVFYDSGNSNILPNFGTINAGTGFNTNVQSPGFVNPGLINASQDRARTRLRFRLGVAAQVADWVSVNARLASGNDLSPVSTNQTLGVPGGFSKYAISLDRANIKFTPVEWASISLGRFENPFWVGETIFDNDLNFDGVAVSLNRSIGDEAKIFASAGAFPIFNTDFNFGSNSQNKTRSRDKYLLGGQIGGEIGLPADGKAKLAVGYFDFQKIEGRRSSLCAPAPTAADTCDTDTSRPQFQQFGNTLFALRNIVAQADPQAATLQYFGLASKFRMLNARAQVGFKLFGENRVTFDGEYSKNLAFKRSRVINSYLNPANPGLDLLVNNFGPTAADGSSTFDGGGTAWSGGVSIGSAAIKDWGDWGVGLGYRHIETDATVDGFNDSDFHLGGTNAKGYTITGTLGLASNTYLQLRWLSSDTITGPRYSNDVLMFDLVAGF
jgi:Putative porin